MDVEERTQVLESTVKAIQLLKGTKKEHKKGISALLKLTGKKEYVELATQKWLDEQGGAMTVDLLENADLENDTLHDLIEDHLRLLQNVCRHQRFVQPLVEAHLVDALLRLLGFCPISELISRALKIVGLVSVEPTAVAQLIEGDALSEIMNHVSISDEAFLTSVLPRLLKDPKMMASFCDHGGLSYLHGVLVFEDESSPKALAGAVAAISQLCKHHGMLARVLAEDEFVVCFMLLLTNKDMHPKVKVHVVRTLYLVAQDAVGFELVLEAVLPLIELIEDRDPEALGVAVAAFDLLGLLCNTTDSIELVEQYGGEGFIQYLLCFLRSPKPAVVEPLCGLLHVLALGTYRDAIIAGLEAELDRATPHKDLVNMTLDLVGGRKRASSQRKPRRSSRQLTPEELGTVDLPAERKQSRVTQTARQGAKRANVLKEIVSTERTYYAGLFSATKCFLEPMKKVSQKPKPVVSAQDIDAIFGNLADIYEIHKNFLKRIDQRIKTNPGGNISDLFSSVADQLLPAYKQYFATYPRAVRLMAEKEKRVKGFRTLCTELTKKIVRGGMGLENYLIMPIQRVPRYAMLLRELEKATLDVHPDKPGLAAAAAKMDTILKELDKVGGPDANGASETTQRRASMPSTVVPKRESVGRKAATVSRASQPKPPPPESLSNGIGSQSWSPSSSALAVAAPDSALLRASQARMEARRSVMVYSSTSVTSLSMSTTINLPQPSATSRGVVKPMLLEGYVMESELGLLRKMVLLRDKLTVLTVPGRVESDFLDETDSKELPQMVYSFPLPHLRFEKEGSGLRLYDTRKGNSDAGVLLMSESHRENNAWISAIFELLYPEED